MAVSGNLRKYWKFIFPFPRLILLLPRRDGSPPDPSEAVECGGLENRSLHNSSYPHSEEFSMYTTYILKSLKDEGYYFGHTHNISSRLQYHNGKQVKNTRHRVPFVIHYTETFLTKSEAYKRELFFKSLEGRLFLKAAGII